ncbi:hypothetical protein M2311_003632 [Rhizobium leguminosarum]|uniref:hypothetical protein n=1 Tax=Rhizobium leguminosarum TaxID=384 RepID=UPI002476376E|nr:hypothetical protein [Rhizobium leguminosarum]MDH6273542.1 hypothetical protein [Rhizobium leguminosarum]
MTTDDDAVTRIEQRLDLEIAATARRLAELVEQRAAMAADAKPTADVVDELRQAAADMGISVFEDTVSEADAARLLGRSFLTLRNRRLADQPIPFERVGRSVRYKLQVLAKHRGTGT